MIDDSQKQLALQISAMIDHSLLHPTLTDKELQHGCETAMKWNTATVCVKPYHVHEAFNLLQSSLVKVCTVIGFPHGGSAMQIKVDETLKAIDDGACEIDMVVNIGKVLSDEWHYVQHEIETINTFCIANESILKVIFENDYLPNNDLKIKLTLMCKDLGVAFVKTSTGYGYNKQVNGMFATNGATLDDCKLMLAHAGKTMKVKAAGGIRTLKDVLAFKELGVARIGATATESIMHEILYPSQSHQNIESKGY